MFNYVNKASRKREKIFDLYSQNLLWIKEHPKITFNPHFEEGYLCPLCFNLFPRQSLQPADPNPLTIEHNPPKSLGGTQQILTCKECNSKTGHKIDSHLVKRLSELDFFEERPNSKIRATLDNSGHKVTSDLSFNTEGTFIINIDRKNSHPIQADNFLANRSYSYKAFDSFDRESLFNSGTHWKLNFTMSPRLPSNERHSEISLLKIAYLYAFQKFGYGFLIHPHLYKVREQILNPTKEILPKVFWIKYDFPEQTLGLNIINKPAELACLLIIFNLYNNSSKRQFAIALPGPDKSGYKIYENLEKFLCQDGTGSIDMNLEHLQDKDYCKDKKSAFALINYWNNLVPREL